MKIASSQFWGTVLIWIGVVFFAVVIYDLVRPYFPSDSPYPWVRRLGLSRATDRPRRAPAPRGPSAPRPPAQVRPDGFITTNIHQTQGNYHLWVWGIPPEKKTGETVEVRIAHAAAGQAGGFWIVAYADTDGDTYPDREIARSDYLTAEQPGQWGGFTFKTGEERIFVGCTWPPGSDTAVYRDNGPWPSAAAYPFESRGGEHAPLFFHTISPQEARSAGPAVTNMQVGFSD